MKTIILELDDDDAAAIEAEFVLRKDRELPEGTSNDAGAMVGEIVRNLVEYRELWEADHSIADEQAIVAFPV